MKYILYILLVAVIFGLVALVDFVFGKLFPSPTWSSTARWSGCPGTALFWGC